MWTKEEVLRRYEDEEKAALSEVEKKIDALIRESITSRTLVGKIELDIPYTVELKNKVLELIDVYRKELDGCIALIHPVKFTNTTCVWRPTVTVQLQSLLNSREGAKKC